MPSKKRKQHLEVDNAVDAPPELAMPVYLVVEHGAEDPAYSVFTVDAAADGGERASHARHLARLHLSSHGMSFVAADSQHGSWIVGVGGSWRHTVIYDPKRSKEISGACLGAPKMHPVLMAIRGKVYAIARRPFVVPTMNFEPWFEVLDLNEGDPFEARRHIGWKELPPPPFFPCYITPLEFRDPAPAVTVTSYVAVGSHILLSLRQEKGTYAFDVEKETWEHVDEKNLPFDGQALPVGNDLFVSRSRTSAAAAIYRIKVSQPSEREVNTKLSVVELSQTPMAAQLLCSLAQGSFCTFSLLSSSSCVPNPSGKLERAEFAVCTSQVDAEGKVVARKKQRRRVYKLRDRSRQLGSPTPLAAALSM